MTTCARTLRASIAAALAIGAAHATLPPAGAAAAAGVLPATPVVARGAQDTVTVEASLTATRAQVGEAFVLQIAVQTGGAAPRRVDAPTPPPGLDVVRTQDYSELQFAMPGGRQRRFRREIVLVGRVPGTYTLPAARVDVDGRVYTTQPLTVTIEATGTRAAPDAATGRTRLRVTADPDTVYAGQQVLLRMEALIPEGTRPRRGRAPVFDAPTPAGVWAQELPQSRHATVRLIGPEVVEVHEYSRALFPISAGALTLPPASLVFEASMGLFGGVQTQRVSSDSLRLTVLPLPLAGRPAAFQGAVGKYALSARLEPATVRAGEPATLTVEIRGEGNVKGLPAPTLPAIAAAQVLGASEESETWPSDGVIHGARRFRWFIIPDRDGVLEIDPIEYAFFDPFEERYEEVATEPLRLGVTPGPAGASPRGPDPVAGPPALRQRPAPDRLGWVLHPAFGALQLVPLLALLGVAFFERSRERRSAAAAVGPRPRGDWRRRLAEPALEPEALLRVFTRALAGLLGGEPGAYRTSAAVERGLAEQGMPADVTARAAGLMRELEAYRFGGREWDAAVAARLQRVAEGVLGEVESSTSAPAGRGAPNAARAGADAGAVGVLLAGLVLASVSAAGAAQSHFAAGLDAYRAGDYDVAARAFTAATAARPRDPAAWYNLGSAQEAAGASPQAVAAWLVALRLDPRAADVRSRLEQAGAREAVRAVTPPFRLRTEELRLLLAALWWLAVGAAVLRMRASARATAWTGGAAAVLLLALGAVALQHERTRRGTVIPLENPTPVRTAPALRAETLHDAVAFRPLRVVERRGNWLRVRTATGEGWIERPPAGDG